MSVFWRASATSCHAQQTALCLSLSLLCLPGTPPGFPSARGGWGVLSTKASTPCGGGNNTPIFSSLPCLQAQPWAGGCPEYEWKLKSCIPFVLLFVRANTLWHRRERHLHRCSHGGACGTASSFLLLNWGAGMVPGVLTPKGGCLCEPVPALHPLKTGKQDKLKPSPLNCLLVKFSHSLHTVCHGFGPFLCLPCLETSNRSLQAQYVAGLPKPEQDTTPCCNSQTCLWIFSSKLWALQTSSICLCPIEVKGGLRNILTSFARLRYLIFSLISTKEAFTF